MSIFSGYNDVEKWEYDIFPSQTVIQSFLFVSACHCFPIFESENPGETKAESRKTMGTVLYEELIPQGKSTSGVCSWQDPFTNYVRKARTKSKQSPHSSVTEKSVPGLWYVPLSRPPWSSVGNWSSLLLSVAGLFVYGRRILLLNHPGDDYSPRSQDSATAWHFRSLLRSSSFLSLVIFFW